MFKSNNDLSDVRMNIEIKYQVDMKNWDSLREKNKRTDRGLAHNVPNDDVTVGIARDDQTHRSEH